MPQFERAGGSETPPQTISHAFSCSHSRSSEIEKLNRRPTMAVYPGDVCNKMHTSRPPQRVPNDTTLQLD